MGLFRRGDNCTDTGNKIRMRQYLSLLSPCQEAVGKPPQKELMKRESTQATWAVCKEKLNPETILPEQTSLVLLLPTNPHCGVKLT